MNKKDPDSWYGPKYYFGLHYDLHANQGDRSLGTRCGKKELVPMLKLMAPDFVQTDCQGHAGYTSWFSKVKHASVPPGLKKDALKQWRAATAELGLPLHCHYSGIWDKAAGAKHPAWCVTAAPRTPSGKPVGQNAGAPKHEKMCPLGPYLDELMIPQMQELIDRYGVDGFWIDGDIWSVEPCYCKKCCTAFTRKTGIAKPPVSPEDPAWPAWWNFTRENFEGFVTRYCEAVHRHKPGVKVCSNWLYTFRHPGEPTVPVDWISGDNVMVFGLDQSRCEARFISTRGKHWDIMLWNAYRQSWTAGRESPPAVKPVQMLTQEAAVTLALGGSVQIYENPGGIRDGRLVPWRQQRLGEVGRFIKKRRIVCQNTETIPQVAVLHSEAHVRSTARGRSLFWGIDVEPVQGAVYALLENHYNVDVLDEWALMPRLAQFPCVVVPERHALSEEMVKALKEYVVKGGRLIVSGAGSFDRFGPSFLGVSRGTEAEEKKYHVPAADGTIPLYSTTWRLVKPSTAKILARLGATPMRKDNLLPHPAATLNRVGKGRVAYIPAGVFRDFVTNRYPLTRAFIGEVARKTIGRLPITVKAPACVDVVLRKKREKTIIHLINRTSGIPQQPNNGAVDEIPPVGPVTITLRQARKPRKVMAAWESGGLTWRGKSKTAVITLDRVAVHEAVVVE